MADMRLEAIITARDEASKVLSNLNKALQGTANELKNTENQAKNMGGYFTGLGNIIKGAVAGFGLMKLGQFAWDLGMTAGRAEELTIAMHQMAKNAGISEKAVDDQITAIKKLHVTTETAASTISQMIGMNMDLTNSTKLVRAAQDLAVIGGTDSNTAVQILINSIGTLDTMQLRQFGITKNLDQVYLDYGRSLGIVSDKTLSTGQVQHIWTRELTETDKHMAIYNLVMDKAAGYTGVYEASLGSVSKNFRSFQTDITNAKEELGKMFAPAMLAIIKTMRDEMGKLVSWFRDHPEDVKRFGEAISDFVSSAISGITFVVTQLWRFRDVILIIGGAIAALRIGKIIEGWIGVIGGAIGKFNIFSQIITSYNAETGKVISSVKGLEAAQWRLNAAMDANPIGVIIIALAAVYGIANKLNSMDWFKNLNPAIQGLMSPLALLIGKYKELRRILGYKDNYEEASKARNQANLSVANSLQEINRLTEEKTKLEAEGKTGSDEYKTTIAALAVENDNLKDSQKEVVVSTQSMSQALTDKSTTESLKQSWGKVKDFFKDAGKRITDSVKDVGNGIKNAWNSVTDFFKGIPIKIGTAWDEFIGRIKEAWNNFVSWLPTAIEAIGKWFNELPNRLAYAIGFMIGLLAGLAVYFWNFLTVTIPTHIVSFANTIWNFFTVIIPAHILSLSNTILNFFTVVIPAHILSLANTIANYFTITIPGYIEILKTWLSTLPGKAMEVVNSVADWFAGLPGRLWEALKGMWASAKAAFDDLKTNAIQWGRDTVNDVVSEFTGLGKKISDAVKGAFSGAKKEAGNLWGSLKSGVTSGFGVFGSDAAGGIIPKTGPYLMHSGESVTPAGSHTAGESISVNAYFYGNINESSGDLGDIGRKLARSIELAHQGIGA